MGTKDGGLFAVDGGFEGGAYGEFGLAEAHIAAHKAVHGTRALHIGLDVLNGAKLVGGVFVEEGGLQFMLQVGVGREGETLFLLPLCVEADEVAGNVFYLALGAVFEALPGAGAELRQLGRHAFGAAVFAELVERVDVDQDDVVVLIEELNHLLGLSGHVGAYETAEAANAVVGVDHEVACSSFCSSRRLMANLPPRARSDRRL